MNEDDKFKDYDFDVVTEDSNVDSSMMDEELAPRFVSDNEMSFGQNQTAKAKIVGRMNYKLESSDSDDEEEYIAVQYKKR